MQLEGLEHFACEHFSIPDLLDLPFGPRPRQVGSKRVLRVEVRNLTPATHDVEPGEQVRLTINALIDVELVARPDGSVLFPIDSEGNGNTITRFNVVAVMEATAVRTQDGYDNFQPVSLNVPTGYLSATQHQKRDADAWLLELREQGLLDG